MPDPNVPQKKGGWGGLSLFQKVIIGVLIILVVYLIINAWFGGIRSFWEFLSVILTLIVIGAIIYFFLKGIFTYLKPSQFSPKDDYFARNIMNAKLNKPRNIRNLYFQGSETKQAVLAGRIIGCTFLPYYVGMPEKNDDGSIKMRYSDFLKRDIPVCAPVSTSEVDGDTLFVYTKKSGWFNEEVEYLRCNRRLHSELHGDVFIDDFNPVVFGKYFKFPYKQAKKMGDHIMVQSLMETIIQTYDHQQDLISQSADAGLYANPYFKMKEKENTELQREG